MKRIDLAIDCDIVSLQRRRGVPVMYDYIVVGGGSSGAVLAARLSEDTAVNVLLVEAGVDYRSVDTPREIARRNSLALLARGDCDRYRWRGIQARLSARQSPSPYFLGRGVGGTSAINGQVAMRALPEDFALWAQEGCAGWDAKSVLPAFVTLERDLDYGDRPGHGDLGPIPISREPQEVWGPMDAALREAALEHGHEWADDHNAAGSTGVSPLAHNSRNGIRVSTNDGYLTPARGRRNLTIVGDALVDRIEFSGATARGVRAVCERGGPQLFQGREIILSAGAVHSPAILLRSGIGPADELRRLGIPVRSASPGVGVNLGEHPRIDLRFPLASVAPARQDSFPHNCCVRYSSGLAGAGRNDMFLGSWNEVRPPEAAGGRWGMIIVAAYQAYSRGRIQLVAGDPTVGPVIDLQLLSDERDLVRMRQGVRELLSLARRRAIRALGEPVFVDDRGRAVTWPSEGPSDDWLLRMVRSVAHPVGTCRMGSESDSTSVVAPDGRVIGVRQLRVVDASIMPAVPRANTHLTCVMIAEHMAQRIISNQR